MEAELPTVDCLWFHQLMINSIQITKEEVRLSTNIINYAVHGWRMRNGVKETAFLFECNVNDEYGTIDLIKLERWIKEVGSMKFVLDWGLSECRDEEDWFNVFDVKLPMANLMYYMDKKNL